MSTFSTGCESVWTSSGEKFPASSRKNYRYLWTARYCGQLLILGAFGKNHDVTGVGRLSADAEEDQPIPVLFELNLEDNKQDVQTGWWLNWYKYGVRINIGKQLLESHQLLPLLDGLDDGGNTPRTLYWEGGFLPGRESTAAHLIVCSRLEEYNFCKTQLEQLNGQYVCIRWLMIRFRTTSLIKTSKL